MSYFTSVKSTVSDVVGGLTVQRTIKYNTFVAIKNIAMREEITINKENLVPGGIFENDNTLHDGSGFFTHTCQSRHQKCPCGAGPHGLMNLQPHIPGGVDKIIAHGVPPPFPQFRYYHIGPRGYHAGQQYNKRYRAKKSLKNCFSLQIKVQHTANSLM